MKHLPKHIRPRYRYLAVVVSSWPDATLDRRDFQRAVWDATRDLIGDVGSAAVDPIVLRFTFDDGAGDAIVRTRRSEVDRARAAIACIDRIDGQPVGVRVAGTSGTVRACEEKYIGERQQSIDERNVVYENAERTAIVRDDRVDVRIDGAFVGATGLDLQ